MAANTNKIAREFTDAVKAITANGGGTSPISYVLGTVKKVNITTGTCDVTPIDGTADLLDCRMYLEGGAYKLIPQVASDVLVATDELAGEYWIAMVSAISKMQVGTNNQFEIDTLTGTITVGSGTNFGVPLESALILEYSKIITDIIALKAALGALAALGANAPGSPILGGMLAPFIGYAALPLIPPLPNTLGNPQFRH